MEIKVGDYIRTKHGYIIKVDERTVIFNLSDDKKEYVDIESTKYGFCFEEEIKKHSPNIIDLVEVGDYVNGKKIESILELSVIAENVLEKILCFETDFPIEQGLRCYHNNDIKTILTHELYEANCYKVGGEDEFKRSDKNT